MLYHLISINNSVIMQYFERTGTLPRDSLAFVPNYFLQVYILLSFQSLSHETPTFLKIVNFLFLICQSGLSHPLLAHVAAGTPRELAIKLSRVSPHPATGYSVAHGGGMVAWYRH